MTVHNGHDHVRPVPSKKRLYVRHRRVSAVALHTVASSFGTVEHRALPLRRSNGTGPAPSLDDGMLAAVASMSLAGCRPVSTSGRWTASSISMSASDSEPIIHYFPLQASGS
jgi:hypothetical protein